MLCYGNTFVMKYLMCFAALLRVLRIFRILRLMSKIPELNVIMNSISSSIKALCYVVALMAIFFFHFAVAGIYLFEENDPEHFEGLVRTFLTLFQVCVCVFLEFNYAAILMVHFVVNCVGCYFG